MAFGVSYYSLTLLHALADRNRIIALPKPFMGGAQYNRQLHLVSAQKGGTYRWDDVCDAVPYPGTYASDQVQKSDAFIVKSANLMEDGEIVPDPRTGKVYGNFIAFFLIVSRAGRGAAIRFGADVEHRVRVITGGF